MLLTEPLVEQPELRRLQKEYRAHQKLATREPSRELLRDVEGELWELKRAAIARKFEKAVRALPAAAADPDLIDTEALRWLREQGYQLRLGRRR